MTVPSARAVATVPVVVRKVTAVVALAIVTESSDIDFVTAGDSATFMWTGSIGWACIASHNALADTGVVEAAQD